MSKELEQIEAEVRKRRKATEQGRIGETLDKEELSSLDFTQLWNAAAPDHKGVFIDRRDMMHGVEKIAQMTRMIPREDLVPFLEWLVYEWVTLKDRHGTRWMHERKFLPHQPDMRFVLHHWHHFHTAWLDREREKAHDYVDPDVKLLREELGRLDYKLREAVFFGDELQLARLREQNELIKIENARLRSMVTDLLIKLGDPDLEPLPPWEDINDDE